MISDTIYWILGNWMTGWFGLFLYWLPLAVCVVGYTIRTMENFQKDLENREKYLRYRQLVKETISDLDSSDDQREKENALRRQVSIREDLTQFYHPTDKIGTLIGRGLVSFVPAGNLWAAMFDVSPRLFQKVFDLVEKIFDAPLVPEPSDKP